MQNLFNIILKTSVSAVPVILLVLCLRQLFKKQPKSYSFALWLVVFACLALPFKMAVKGLPHIDTMVQQGAVQLVERFDSTQQPQQQQPAESEADKTGQSPVVNVKPETQTKTKPQQTVTITTPQTETTPHSVQNTPKAFTLKLWHIWLCGILVLIAFEIVSLKGIWDKTRFAFKKQDNVYYCDQTAVPFVYGLVKPKIILPSDISPLTEPFVIRHEQSHINRRDYIIKPLCFVIAIVHWFNPLVWLSFFLMVKDMELSCDENVVKNFNTNGRQKYCEALLNFAVKDKPYKVNAVLFGEGNCSVRIKNVLGFKRPQKLAALVLCLCVALVGCTAFTTGKQPQQFDFEGWSLEQLEAHLPNSDEERFALVNAMNSVPESEIEAYFAKVIKDYCADSDLAQLVDLTVSRDNLAMVYNTHRKALANCTLALNMELLPYDTTDFDLDAQKQQQIKQFFSDLLVNLTENYDFVKYSVNNWTFRAVGESGRTIYESETNAVNDFDGDSESITYKEKLYRDQTQQVLSAQRAAFDYGKDNGVFALKKFGIPQAGQLYLEYCIVGDDYFLVGDGKTEAKIAAATAELNDVYAEICEKVIQNDNIQQYIAANGLRTAVVAFSHRFLENGIVEFPLIVEQTAFVPDYDVRFYDGIDGETGFIYEDLWVKESEAVDILWFSDATFVGDSMTEGLRIYTTIANSVGDIANFVSARNLSPSKVVEGIIDNFDYMEAQNGMDAIAATNPEKIYFSMGTNALVEMSEKDFFAEYVDMLKTARGNFPDAQIYVTSVPPVTKEFTESRNLPVFKPENLQYINGQLAQIANDNGTYYLNLYEVLADDDGYLKEEFANTDGIHLVPDAYTVWVEYLMTHTVDENDSNCGYPKQEYFNEETEIITEEADQWSGFPEVIHLPMLEVGKYVFPVDMANENIRISRGYSGQYPSHDGVDIAGPYGTEIFASADGKVIKAEESTVGDGKHVVIEHANGYYTLYGHCSELLVKAGDEVKQGDVIAKMGSTGNSTGNHVHFEFGFGYGSEPNGGLSLDPYNAVEIRDE